MEELESLLNRLELLIQGQGEELSLAEIKEIQSVLHVEQEVVIQEGESVSTNQVENINTTEQEIKEKIRNAFDRLQNKVVKKVSPHTEEANLKTKKTLIEELKLLVASEETNLGALFQKYNHIKTSWRETGPVPSKEYQALQQEYRFLNEKIIYTIKIYKDLKEHDFKRNSQLKQDIISKLERLLEIEDIKEVEPKLQALQNEWDEIGPTTNEEWIEIRPRFKELLNKIYERIHIHHQKVYEQMSENLKKKHELIASIEAINAKEITGPKEWDELTKVVIELQAVYKNTGYARRKENEQAWTKFREECNLFFQKKNDYFGELKARGTVSKEKRQELIDKAKEWLEKADWRAGTDVLIKLQKEWRELGPPFSTLERKMWDTFKSTCDEFFKRKNEAHSEQDRLYAEELEQKQVLLTNIQQFSPSDNPTKDFEGIQELIIQWESLENHSRRDQKSKLDHMFNEFVEQAYKKLPISDEEREELRFSRRLELINQKENSKDLISKERQYLREQIQKLESTISKMETNLSFFSKSKNASDILKDTLADLEKNKNLLAAYKKKIKLLSQ